MSLRSYIAGSAIGIGVALTSTAASADCFVRDADEKGLFGQPKQYSRQFSGSSVTQIWDKYCKPFLQETIQNKGIENGEFGMHCTGRLSCDIRGEIVGGRVQAPTRTRGLRNE